jgi:hypothetical protein
MVQGAHAAGIATRHPRRAKPEEVAG